MVGSGTAVTAVGETAVTAVGFPYKPSCGVVCLYLQKPYLISVNYSNPVFLLASKHTGFCYLQVDIPGFNFLLTWHRSCCIVGCKRITYEEYANR